MRGYLPPGIPSTAGQPGYNEHGVPLHACHGYRHDEHYWAWVHARRPFTSSELVLMNERWLGNVRSALCTGYVLFS